MKTKACGTYLFSNLCAVTLTAHFLFVAGILLPASSTRLCFAQARTTPIPANEIANVVAAPVMTGLSRTYGANGVAVTITGRQFGAAQGASTLTFNGVPATSSQYLAMTWSDTSITAPVPASATSGNVVVTVAGQSSNALGFRVMPSPVVTGISPISGPPGTAVAITGRNLLDLNGTASVSIGSLFATTINSKSSTSVQVLVPAGASTGSVRVHANGAGYSGQIFTVTRWNVVTNLAADANPQVAEVGVSFTAYVDTSAGGGTATGSVGFLVDGGVPVRIAVDGTGHAAFRTSALGAGVHSVVATYSGDGTHAPASSAPLQETIYSGPVMTALSRSYGASGVGITVTGRHFGTTQGASTLTFNGVPATSSQYLAISWSDTSITAPVPANATSGHVVVTTAGRASNALGFQVMPPPVVTGISPISGPIGTLVTITGKNLLDGDGSSSVSFGALFAAIHSKSSSSIHATVPASAASGPVRVHANGSGYDGPIFTVTAGANIPTWHVDNNRSGLNANETSLTPLSVTSPGFGKLFSYLVDGYVYGEPLILSNLSINGATRNAIYVATEHDTVYAFDADNGNPTPLWRTSLLASGETPLSGAAIAPWEGVTSTPVIDVATGTMYVVSAQTSQATGGTFRLNALDIITGQHRVGSPVTINASVAGTNPIGGNGTFVPLTTHCIQRAALLLANHTVYMGMSGCPSGWLLAYSASTLAQVGVFNSSPNLPGEGTYASAGGIWMGSGGPVADSAGNVYVTTGNGPWDGLTAWSDSVLKFPAVANAGPNGTMQPSDYFTPNTYQYTNCADGDLSAGGLLLIPGTNTLVSGGKLGRIFLNSDAQLGHESPNDAGVEQELWFESDLIAPSVTSCIDVSGTHQVELNSYQIYGTGAYYDGYVYLGVSPKIATTVAPVRQFLWNSSALTLTPGAYTSPSQTTGARGTTPFISSNGNTNGIVWMLNLGVPLQQGAPTSAVLYAYDADSFPRELYNSSQNPTDAGGYAIKFTSPVVANGKVYVSTGHDLTTVANPEGEIVVYGLK